MEGDVRRWCGDGLCLVKLRWRTPFGEVVVEGDVGRWCGRGKCG